MKNCLVLIFLLLYCFEIAGVSGQVPLRDRMQPVPKESGFSMPGYWVWGGSVIKVNDKFHMFASRWPKDRAFPKDYRQKSEIVRASSDNFEGPYVFDELVIGERDSLYWDSNMAHNPTIHLIDGKYVLFYIGSDFTTLHANGRQLLRRVGYATASVVTGPWKRSEKPVILLESNNPAVYVEEDGSIKLMYRDEKLRIFLAKSDDYRGPYEVKNDNVWPECKLEDFYLFKHQGKYRMICEDNVGGVSGHVRWGVDFESQNGIDGWKPNAHAIVYDHEILWNDGTSLFCVRRERPQLYIENGRVKGLLTSVYDGENSWCQPVRIEPAY